MRTLKRFILGIQILAPSTYASDELDGYFLIDEENAAGPLREGSPQASLFFGGLLYGVGDCAINKPLHLLAEDKVKAGSHAYGGRRAADRRALAGTPGTPSSLPLGGPSPSTRSRKEPKHLSGSPTRSAAPARE
jgi:hypothetical protein